MRETGWRRSTASRAAASQSRANGSSPTYYCGICRSTGRTGRGAPTSHTSRCREGTLAAYGVHCGRADRCARPIETNQARMRYAEFRAQGLPVGSGVGEGATMQGDRRQSPQALRDEAVQGRCRRSHGPALLHPQEPLRGLLGMATKTRPLPPPDGWPGPRHLRRTRPFTSGFAAAAQLAQGLYVPPATVTRDFQGHAVHPL